MVQVQPVEKLHSACDECRNRKLKCSGGAPRCVRCERESIDCIYSPKKQMGRPRKRRREDAPELATETATEAPISNDNGHDTNLNESSTPPCYDNFGLQSPPDLQDLSSGVNNYEAIPHDFPYAETHNGTIQVPTPELGPDTPVDPALWFTQSAESQQHSGQDSSPDQSSLAACTCLSLSYLTLMDLQSMSSLAFPQVIIPLRKAMDTIASVVNCPVCPKEGFSSIQNVQSIVSLFKAVVERFHKVLDEIDAEAARLEQSGLKKPYRIGDNSPGLRHLHTGTPDCPMGFNIDIEPRDWRKLVKTALKTEVYGGGSNQRPLMLLLKEAEARQARWHVNAEFHCDTRKRMFGPNPSKISCVALGSDFIKLSIDRMEWE